MNLFTTQLICHITACVCALWTIVQAIIKPVGTAPNLALRLYRSYWLAVWWLKHSVKQVRLKQHREQDQYCLCKESLGYTLEWIFYLNWPSLKKRRKSALVNLKSKPSGRLFLKFYKISKHFLFQYCVLPWRKGKHWLFLYPLKTSENLCFSDVFKGYRMKAVEWNGLTGCIY